MKTLKYSALALLFIACNDIKAQHLPPETGQSVIKRNIEEEQHDQKTIEQVQAALDERGYSVDQVKGRWGYYSLQRALMDFQANEKIDVSGQIDQQTLEALGLSEKVAE